MKYICSWIEKELKPDKTQKSGTTASVYFTFDNYTIRVSDHFGRAASCDMNILVTRDVVSNTKHFILKDENYPTIMSINDVKSLKVAISTILWMHKNKCAKDNINLNRKHIYDFSIKSTTLNKAFIEKRVQFLRVLTNTDIDDRALTAFADFLQVYVPYNTDIPKSTRKILFYICRSYSNLSPKDAVDKILGIIEKHVSQDDVLLHDSKYINNQLIEYVSKDFMNEIPKTLYMTETVTSNTSTDVTNVDDTESLVSDNGISPTEKQEPITISDEVCITESVDTKSPLYRKAIKKFNENVVIRKKTEAVKNRLCSYLGTLLSEDLPFYKLLTNGQKRSIRSCISSAGNMKYDDIYAFAMYVFKVSDNVVYPNTNNLNTLVKTYTRLYNAGKRILDFDIPKSYLVPDGTVIEENIEESMTIIPSIMETDPILSKKTEPYSNITKDSIVDVTTQFDSNSINIVNAVISKIESTGTITSFENKRIMDIFAKHYESIWSHITNTQKEICVKLITSEHMSLNESDFIINYVFDKSKFVWPDTTECKNVIPIICTKIRELREAA